MDPRCPWCKRRLASWQLARIHCKNCSASPRPRWKQNLQRQAKYENVALYVGFSYFPLILALGNLESIKIRPSYSPARCVTAWRSLQLR